jgi:hypothetical protein
MLQETHELAALRCARRAAVGAGGGRLGGSGLQPGLRPAMRFLRLMRCAFYHSTIYMLIIALLAVQGIPAVGNAVEPSVVRRDVWAGLWVIDFFLVVQVRAMRADAERAPLTHARSGRASQVAVLALYTFCAVNGCVQASQLPLPLQCACMPAQQRAACER